MHTDKRALYGATAVLVTSSLTVGALYNTTPALSDEQAGGGYTRSLDRALANSDSNILPVADYISTKGTTTPGTEANTGVFNGTWNASIPMGKVMKNFESEMKRLAEKGAYPHGKDGVNTIAYIDYTVEFPQGVTIDTDKITMKNTCAMFNANAFTKKVEGNKVRFKIPLNDVNWKQILEAYNSDGGSNSNKTIDLTIPYSVAAKNYDEAKKYETAEITSKGDFETHPSGSWYSWLKTVYTTDTSTVKLAAEFSKAKSFTQPETPENISANLDADISLDTSIGTNTTSDTGNTVITKKKDDALDFVGALYVKAIKDKLAEIEQTHSKKATTTRAAREARAAREDSDAHVAETKLEGLSSTFTATLTLPSGIAFDKNAKAELIGANGVFEISKTEITTENNGQKATVTMQLKDASSITTFEQLKTKINSVDDWLKVKITSAHFTKDSEGDTEYQVVGSITGDFKAKATFGDKVINFALSWSGKQSEAGKDSTNPNAISLRVKYPKNIEAALTLPGDLLVGDNTQHDGVYVAGKNDRLKFTGTLDVSGVKKQMKNYEEMYNKAQLGDSKIAISNYSSTFVAALTLPNEMDFDTDCTVSLLNDNNKYKIVSHEVKGKTLTVTMTVAKDVKTFADLKDAVNGMDDVMKVSVDGVRFNNSAKADTNYTVRGTMNGSLQATATNEAKKAISFTLKWNAEQSKDGADSTNPTAKDITLTLKYKERPRPVDPDDNPTPPTPHTPTPEAPTPHTPTPNTPAPAPAPQSNDNNVPSVNVPEHSQNRQTTDDTNTHRIPQTGDAPYAQAAALFGMSGLLLTALGIRRKRK